MSLSMRQAPECFRARAGVTSLDWPSFATSYISISITITSLGAAGFYVVNGGPADPIGGYAFPPTGLGDQDFPYLPSPTTLLHSFNASFSGVVGTQNPYYAWNYIKSFRWMPENTEATQQDYSVDFVVHGDSVGGNKPSLYVGLFFKFINYREWRLSEANLTGLPIWRVGVPYPGSGIGVWDTMDYTVHWTMDPGWNNLDIVFGATYVNDYTYSNTIHTCPVNLPLTDVQMIIEQN